MSTNARPGQVVAERYVLQSVAGVGGMGAVWRAYDQVAGVPVALKEFAAGACEERQAWREARAAERVDHPAVLHVHDVAVTDRPWMVMELIDGATLAEEIRTAGRLDLPTTLTVARQLLGALGAVHKAGLVHRDVKPGNVLIDDGGHVTLTDFGLASAAGDVPATPGQLLGSPPYIAPEALQGVEAGAAGDLFAYGATLFTAIEGRRPFARDTAESTLEALLHEPLPPMEHAGPLEPLISGLLRRDPDRRLSAVHAGAHIAAVARAEDSAA